MSLGGSYGEGTSNQQYQQQGTSSTSSDFTKNPLNMDQINSALGQAQGLYNNGSPTLAAGMNGVNSGAAGATSLFNSANPSLTNTLKGSYLSSGNPDFQSMLTQSLQGLQPTIDGQFEQSGRYGGGANANAWASAATNLAGSLGYQNYTNERGNQLTAAGQLPNYTTGMLQPGQAQLSAGYLPIQQLIQALSALSPGSTGTSTSNTATTGSGTQQGNTSNWGINASV